MPSSPLTDVEGYASGDDCGLVPDWAYERRGAGRGAAGGAVRMVATTPAEALDTHAAFM